MSKRNYLLNSLTVLALHIIRALHDDEFNRYIKGDVVAREAGISITHFDHSIFHLKKAGIIKSRKGCRGGYRLDPEKDLETITLEDLYQIMHPVQTSQHKGHIVPNSISNINVMQAVNDLIEQTNAQLEVSAC